MAKDKITEYDATANNNTVCGDVNIAENSALPSDMNNFAREIMSHLKEGLGSGTPLYVDQTNNRVGIGNSNPTDFGSLVSDLVVGTTSGEHGITIASGTGNGGRIQFADNTATPFRGAFEYDHSTDSMFVYNTGTQRMKIDANGHVTMPYQPAFLAKPSTAQNNLTNNPSGVDLIFDTEIFDQNADYNNSNYTFTAPVTGKYNLFAHAYLYNLSGSANVIYITLQTSNRSIFGIIDPNFGQDNEYWTLTASMIFDMDANDTAKVTWLQSGGTAQTHLQPSSHFGGHLVC